MKFYGKISLKLYLYSRIDTILMKFKDCKYIISFDLTSGFFQIPLHENSQKYVAFSVFGRVYNFIRLPFGLSISSSEFIKCLYQVLGKEILEWVIVYIDDLAICSKNLEEHMRWIKLLFHKLRDGNLTLELSKSKFTAKVFRISNKLQGY